MHSRRVRLAAAAGYLLGFACFLVGVTVEFTASTGIGTALLGVGTATMIGTRIAARRLRLPAP